jgi:uncharacterized membrane protein HdeD (DUF308 family)
MHRASSAGDVRPKEDTMSEHVGHAGTPAGGSGLRALARDLSSYWWLSLVAGICWIVVGVVILQFDETSVRTIGLIVGFMFLFAGFQTLALAAGPISLRWVWVTFGVLLIIAGIVSLAYPEDTFAGLADMLSFLFLLVGLWWIVRAFLEQEVNRLWWLGLIAGILMTGLAFWTAGQFFIEKAYVLLVFAGIWALMEGFVDISRAFALLAVNREA